MGVFLAAPAKGISKEGKTLVDLRGGFAWPLKAQAPRDLPLQDAKRALLFPTNSPVLTCQAIKSIKSQILENQKGKQEKTIEAKAKKPLQRDEC